MRHVISIIVDRKIIVKAINIHWLSIFGWSSPAVWLLVLSLWGYLFYSGNRSYPFVFLTVIGLALPGLWIAAYFALLSRSLSRYDKLKSKQIEYAFTEEGVELSSELGAAQIPWHSFTHMKKCPDVWMLYMGKHSYTYLPLEQVKPAAQEFIQEQAKKHGLKFA